MFRLLCFVHCVLTQHRFLVCACFNIQVFELVLLNNLVQAVAKTRFLSVSTVFSIFEHF